MKLKVGDTVCLVYDVWGMRKGRMTKVEFVSDRRVHADGVSFDARTLYDADPVAEDVRVYLVPMEWPGASDRDDSDACPHE